MRILRMGLSALLLAAMAAGAQADATVPSPKDALGHEIGEDYYLANYSQLVSYWQLLASQSDRMRLVEFGRTSENRPQYMAIVSSAANLQKLDHYRETAARLARAEGLTDELAHALAREGKAVVWVDGGLHASEVECAQALIQQVYDLVSSEDPEAVRIRENTIVVFAQDNPDGQELVANWYMRIPEPTKREPDFSSLPKLYHPWIGHDNNRDFYMVAMPETTNISRVLFREWYPQIIHNQHQRGPIGAIVFMPPFRDPFNYNFDPLIITELEELGAKMHSRLIEENKPGSTMRGTASYDTWYNGGLRNVSYFHNAIGVLTEISGMPTPMKIPLVARHQLPRNDLPFPVPPQTWHMKQAIEYSVSFNRALMSYAADNRERLLYNRYVMARNAIARGRRDNWTITADRVDALMAAAALSKKTTSKPDEPNPTQGSENSNPPASVPSGPSTEAESVDAALYDSVLHDPAFRDARGYVIPSDQTDFPTAIRFLNALIKSGVIVQRATQAFTIKDHRYPAGSFIVRTDQAYRPHVLDMFEPQDHPHNSPYPGAPPTPPADAAGYTLAFQMGVKFDRILDDFSGPFEPVADLITPPPGAVIGNGRGGYLISHQANNSFILTSRLLKAGQRVQWLTAAVSVGRVKFAPGAIWAPASAQTDSIVRAGVRELGISAYAVSARPRSHTVTLKQPRIALVDLYGGLMPTGWTRWIFEQFEIPYTVVYPKRLDRGDLQADFDLVLLTDSAIPNERSGTGGGMFRGRFDIKQPAPEAIPEEYRDWLGTITAEKTMPQIRSFLAHGGSVIAIGSSAVGLARDLQLPVTRGLTETVDGKEVPLPRTKFYVPGSLLTANVDPTQPLAYGMPERVDLFFDSSPVFRAAAGAPELRKAAWFSGEKVLHSGWAFGPKYLDGAAAAVEVPVDAGKVFLFGPEVAMRGQSHAAFKLLFNAVYYGAAESK